MIWHPLFDICDENWDCGSIYFVKVLAARDEMQWGEAGPPPLLVKIAPDLSRQDLSDIAAVWASILCLLLLDDHLFCFVVVRFLLYVLSFVLFHIIMHTTTWPRLVMNPSVLYCCMFSGGFGPAVGWFGKLMLFHHCKSSMSIWLHMVVENQVEGRDSQSWVSLKLVCFNENQCHVMLRLPLSVSVALMTLTRIICLGIWIIVFQPCLVQSVFIHYWIWNPP